ncbi:MAG: hypothetical protein LBT21_07100, partial [Oscillospiraceae bacterium]|nr:hypothetical protein [Oscillospiraceae bacterium]
MKRVIKRFFSVLLSVLIVPAVLSAAPLTAFAVPGEVGTPILLTLDNPAVAEITESERNYADFSFATTKDDIYQFTVTSANGAYVVLQIWYSDEDPLDYGYLLIEDYVKDDAFYVKLQSGRTCTLRINTHEWAYNGYDSGTISVAAVKAPAVSGWKIIVPTITENTGGYWQTDESGQEFYYYSFTYSLELTFADGNTKIFSQNNPFGYYYLVDDQYENHFVLGDNTISAHFGEDIKPVTLTVVKGAHIHNFTELVSKINAACEAPGMLIMKCPDDDATEETVLPALGHDWGAWVLTKAATISAAGTETRTCKHDSSHTETRA